MKAIIIAAVLAASIAGPAAAECVAGPLIDVTATPGQDQKLWGYHTYWPSHEIVSAPDWMRIKPGVSRQPGWRVLELWGVPRAGTYQVKVRYTRPEKSVTCTSNLRFK
ncbi:hypothetical protein CFBP5507_14535 [Agrobacterium salinitolerans]|uniref:Uncharacterized protein n=1 Tax=Agrobacterium salinitolerans TaxID=1183413 RepID=A0A4Z1QUU0_9HYPH|nr:hypothetical protein [Agrobacterium salinitolerans]UYZ07416.1 hypothetical protein CFBP5507_14535 [Agrobacterium salinitolerans]